MKEIKNIEWTLYLEGEELTSEQVESLKIYQFVVYFNDVSAYYWIYNFKLFNTWFEAYDIDCVNKTMKLNAFK